MKLSTAESPLFAYEFEGFVVDSATRSLMRSGERVPLTPRVFDTLLYFVRNSGRVLEKDELIRAVWPDGFVEENNLNQNVSVLRRALGEARGDNRFIVTVPGHGYRFAANVVERPGTKAGHHARIIAVLPFKPLMEQHRDEALELGMADSLIMRLSNSHELVVRPLTSVRRYNGIEQDACAAGRELGVESVLDGRIQRWGNRIRVTADLLRVDDGVTQWSGIFDEDSTDLFAVQDSISVRVAVALALTLSAEEKQGLTRRYTANTEAYELYIQGRFHWSRLTPPEIKRSIGFFERAIADDPSFALPYSGLAEAYRSLPMTSEASAAEVFPRANEAVEKALALDASLVDAHASRAIIRAWHQWDWEGALAEARLAITLNPNSSEAHRALGLVLSHLGRVPEAITESEIARALDPLALLTRTHESLYLYYAHQPLPAIAKLQITLELEPTFWIALLTLAKVYVLQGRLEDALAELAKARQSSGGNSQVIALAGFALAVAGDEEGALEMLAELRANSQGRYVPPFSFAVIYNGIGDDEETLNWLERSMVERDSLLAAFVNVDPIWDRFRDMSRFRAILSRMRLLAE
ncbi:MAG: winged helix-turn-helix domain-containing protein [bacterium]